MIMDKCNLDSISDIANKFKKLVDNSAELTLHDIQDLTKISNKEFYATVGWLARENEICKTGALYRLGDTNLTSKIGTDAGKIWKVLETRGTFDVSNISVLTRLDERDAYSALGWLARENKIDIHKTKKKTNEISIEPRYHFNDNTENKNKSSCIDRKQRLQSVLIEEKNKQALDFLTRNSAESLKRMFSDISIEKYSDSSEIEKIIDLKFKGFDINGASN